MTEAIKLQDNRGLHLAQKGNAFSSVVQTVHTYLKT